MDRGIIFQPTAGCALQSYGKEKRDDRRNGGGFRHAFPAGARPLAGVAGPGILFPLKGIGFTLLIVSEAPFLMAASDDKNRSLLFSLNFGLLTLSSAVGAVFAGQMPALVASRMNVSPESITSYGAVLLVSLLIGVFSIWPLLRIDEREIHDSQTRKQDSHILAALKKGLVWKLFLPNLVLGFGAAILIPYMNVFFTEKFMLSSPALGVLFAISSLFTAIGSILGPALAQRMG